MTRLRDELAAVLAAGDPPDLGRAALTIARIGYPDLEPDPYLAELDALAKVAATRVRPGAPPEEAVRAVSQYLFGERGFDAVSVRAVASEAGVDPALVHH